MVCFLSQNSPLTPIGKVYLATKHSLILKFMCKHHKVVWEPCGQVWMEISTFCKMAPDQDVVPQGGAKWPTPLILSPWLMVWGCAWTKPILLRSLNSIGTATSAHLLLWGVWLSQLWGFIYLSMWFWHTCMVCVPPTHSWCPCKYSHAKLSKDHMYAYYIDCSSMACGAWPFIPLVHCLAVIWCQ